MSDPEAFERLFSDFASTAYRLEVRTAYGVASEDVPFQRYLAGEDPGIQWLQPWLDLMSEQTGRGKRVSRVRVVDSPPSDYLRWEIVNTPHNLRAGEDIRYLTRSRARKIGLPRHDYWVFDEEFLALLEFGADDRFLGFRLVADATAVAAHLEWQKRAWRHALPYARYVAEEFADGCADGFTGGFPEGYGA
ncbi:hypothetical protein DVA86_24155 [Streptomyces armeniacus]|uniref:DUF6879 domain-containing protein n=1 Tax=Streptomyces armeniacus TaxID=83291 RepID=A0A345Y140_9ACTN|nr:hypothetical protein DVA86_24155 [Streptomyces armeniacus]